MNPEEGNESHRATKEVNDLSKDLARFKEPDFKQRLRTHILHAIISQSRLDVHSVVSDADENQEIGAIGWICEWIKLRPTFQALDCLGEILLNDPDCASDIRVAIHQSRVRKRLLHQKSAQCADLIGGKYAKLLLDGDIAGRNKLDKLIRSIERQQSVTPGSPTKRPLLPWSFFVALAALESLNARIVPTQKRVRERTMEIRVLIELGIGDSNPAERNCKIAELLRYWPRPRSWKRIIHELDLVGLPKKEERF
jgi:hypothetical protein